MKQKNNGVIKDMPDEVVMVKRDLGKSLFLSIVAIGIIIGVYIYLHPTIITLLTTRG